MTGGQVSLSLDADAAATASGHTDVVHVQRDGLVLPVLQASAEEQAAHEAMLGRMRSQRNGPVLWDSLAEPEDREPA